jgi:beta-N-acetylhexosaminidase
VNRFAAAAALVLSLAACRSAPPPEPAPAAEPAPAPEPAAVVVRPSAPWDAVNPLPPGPLVLPERRAAPAAPAAAPPDAAPAAAPATPAAPIADIYELAAALPLRAKIAQLFIAWIPKGADAAALAALKDQQAAGYILYPWNYASIDDVRALTATLSAAGPSPAGPELKPFLCVDQEGGRVAAFRFKEFPAQPSAWLLGSLADPRLVEANAYSTGLILSFLGVNMDLAPVADLYGQPDGTIIGDRSFGPDPDKTGRAVAAFVRGLTHAGIIATVKHFPGHGVTTVDSHGDLPRASVDPDDLRARVLAPFRAGIAAGAPVVMTAHIVYEKVDPDNPATLSPAILQGILRGELGFQGLILTDGFEMGALSKYFTKADSLARAFAAGVDLILLYNRYDLAEMIGLTEGLVRSGRLSEAALTRSVERVLAVKQRYGLLRLPYPGF